MTLALVNYIFPALVGYLLFCGISGRLNPLTLSHHAEDKASWHLGIWVSLCAALVLGMAIYMATKVPINGTLTIIPPALALLACLLAPALYLYFSSSSRKKSNQIAAGNFDWALEEENLQQASRVNVVAAAEHPLDATLQHKPEPASEVGLAYLETVEINQLTHDSTQEAMNDSDTSSAFVEESSQRDNLELEEKLLAETETRIETEKHLRITRKALSVLEVSTRDMPDDSSEVVIELEESLAKSLEKAASLESKVISEQTQRMKLEQKSNSVKQRLVSAKTEIRRSAAARAKALGTANKSIAFARQSVQIRERLESKLNDAQVTLKNQQKTISSLIRALEKEKNRTQEEIASTARQLVLHEKQVRTRRSVEAVARSVENKLATRLVKKVAKARPLTSDMNHGEPT